MPRTIGATSSTAGNATAQEGSQASNQAEANPLPKPRASAVDMPDTISDIMPESYRAESVVAAFLRDPYFSRPPPKSLDRDAFALIPSLVAPLLIFS